MIKPGRSSTAVTLPLLKVCSIIWQANGHANGRTVLLRSLFLRAFEVKPPPPAKQAVVRTPSNERTHKDVCCPAHYPSNFLRVRIPSVLRAENIPDLLVPSPGFCFYIAVNRNTHSAGKSCQSLRLSKDFVFRFARRYLASLLRFAFHHPPSPTSSYISLQLGLVWAKSNQALHEHLA